MSEADNVAAHDTCGVVETMKADTEATRKPKSRGSAAAVEEPVRRRPGRPAGSNVGISLASILRTSYRLAKTVPLQELSIVFVAKKLGVTPALIHHYVGGRDWLPAGTMTLFYSDLLRKLPDNTGDWKRDIPKMARAIYDHLVLYAGVAAYM